MNKQILFVDDEPHLLDGLKRSLRGQRNVWDMTFAQSGMQALELAQQLQFDAVITDMRMPDMDGAQLLSQLAQFHPEAIRVILSGYSDEVMNMKSVASAHQYLAKPIDPQVLADVLNRAFILRELLADEKLKRLISMTGALPSLPEIYQKLTSRLQSPDVTMKEVGEIITGDPPMMAKLLQLVNSAFFGIGRRVSNPAQAAMLLGLDTLKALVLSVGIFSQFETRPRHPRGFSIGQIWQHNVLVGIMARDIAELEEAEGNLLEDSLAAGLLHDIGKLILAFDLPEEWQQIQLMVQQQGISSYEAEQAVLGTTHASLGAYLLGLWGLPESVVEAVAFHHQPVSALHQGFCPLTAVHIADALQQGNDMLDMDYLDGLGFNEQQTAAWQKLVTESANSKPG